MPFSKNTNVLNNKNKVVFSPSIKAAKYPNFKDTEKRAFLSTS